MRRARTTLIAMLAALLLSGTPARAAARWSPEQAAAWRQRVGWLVGCNYLPRTAINQLEMWQRETWDPVTIDQELGWAADLGFNSLRVFLHDLLWAADREGYLRRIEQFLDLAGRRRIGVVFVLFDSVWDPHPRLGRQREPTPHLHNSGWVQSPGVEILRHPDRFARLKGYVQGLLRRFGRDRRVHAWDLWNEPDNNNGASYRPWDLPNKGEVVTPYLRQVFAWAQEANPDQPLTAGVWIGDWSSDERLRPWERVMLEESDVISYHNYGPLEEQRRRVGWLKRYGRPLLCTEYMARPLGSTFESVLPFLKAEGVGAYNWGFVSGKSQTIYPWDSWQRHYSAEPPLWFHDIFRPDGTPYRAEEVALIRRLTGAATRSQRPAPAGVARPYAVRGPSRSIASSIPIR